MFIPTVRASLLIPTPSVSNPDSKHLFVILTRPYQLPNEQKKSVLLVSFSTVHPRCDRTCIMTSEDHQFFNRESFVVYYKAIIENTEMLSNEVRDGKFVEKEPFREDVFERICKGFLTSPNSLPRHINFYHDAQQ